MGGVQRMPLRSLSSVRSANALRTPGDGVDPVGVAVPVRDLADRGVHGLGDRQPDRLVGAGLDLAGPPGPLDGLAAQRVEEHGLADAAQPRDDHAALGAAGGHPLEGDVELRQLAVAAGELGGSLAGAGGVRVPDRVHDRTVSGCLAIRRRFRYRTRSCRRPDPSTS